MELNEYKLKANIAEAWAEAKKCSAAFFNCCYQDQSVNEMLRKHAALLDYLGTQLWQHREEVKRLQGELDTAKAALNREKNEVVAKPQ